MSNEVIGMLIAAVFGGGGIGSWLTYRQGLNAARLAGEKQKLEHELAVENARAAQALAASNQPVDHYRSLVDTLIKRTDRLEDAYSQSINHQIKCEGAMGELRGEVSVLRESVTHFREMLTGRLSPPVAPVRQVGLEDLALSVDAGSNVSPALVQTADRS